MTFLTGLIRFVRSLTRGVLYRHGTRLYGNRDRKEADQPVGELASTLFNVPSAQTRSASSIVRGGASRMTC